MSMKDEFTLVTGKNGTHFIRRKNGDALALFQWNTRTGEPGNDNAFTERVYHLLRLSAHRSIEELQQAQALLLLHDVPESDTLEIK